MFHRNEIDEKEIKHMTTRYTKAFGIINFKENYTSLAGVEFEKLEYKPQRLDNNELLYTKQ